MAPLSFQENIFNFNLESNPETIVFQASMQTITPYKFKYHDSCQMTDWICHKTIQERDFKPFWYLILNGVMVCIFIWNARGPGFNS